jgi:glycerol-3-phosphate dehydrogenase (NAD(P)+)
MKVGIVGAGGWGTALGLVLDQLGHEVVFWGHSGDNLRAMQAARENKRYLPGVRLPEHWSYGTEIEPLVAESEGLVMAVPSKAFRETAARLAGFKGLVISVTKGIESETGLTMSAILRECAPGARVAALSGPSLAPEVARGVPTATVVAGEGDEIAREAQSLFHGPRFRVYTSADLLGVQLGGALKNVIAIAAGAGDGMGFGDNTKAALITRGIAEIRRLGVRCGAQAETFAGLSGLGDLTVTCFSRMSRNRTFGERLGRGESVEQVLTSTATVAEGYPTTRSAYQLARKLKVETPIIDQLYQALYENKPAAEAVFELMSRESKAED